MKLSKPVGGAIGAGMVALAAISAVKAAGSRIRHHHDPELDALADPPDGPLHHHLATHDGGEIHVVEQGAGRPIVLLHGVLLQWSVWSAVFALMSSRSRVIAWDMRGHGESIAGSDGVSLDAVGDDLAMVLDELDLHDAIVVGHSMGGMAIGHFVRRHPDTLHERVAGLCFLATSASALARKMNRGSLKTVYGVAGRALIAGLRRPNPRYGWSDNNMSAVMLRTAFGPDATAETVDAVRRMVAAVPTATMIQAGNALASHDERVGLREIDVPTVVVVGDVDRITPPDHAEELAEIVPGAELHVLGGVGHQVMQEAPHELVEILDEMAARLTIRV